MGNAKLVGAAIGLIISIVIVWQGPLEALIVALFTLGGWLIGKYFSGEIPILDALLERFIASRRGRRR
jgi:ABC-type tungstate transport system substrate-binding protein